MHLCQTVLEKHTSSFHENIWKQQRLKTKEETTYTNTHQPKTSTTNQIWEKNTKTIQNSNNNQPSNQPTKQTQPLTNQPTKKTVGLKKLQGAGSSSTVSIPIVACFQASYCFVPWFWITRVLSISGSKVHPREVWIQQTLCRPSKHQGILEDFGRLGWPCQSMNITTPHKRIISKIWWRSSCDFCFVA